MNMLRNRRACCLRGLVTVTLLALASSAAAEEPFDYFTNSWNVIGLKDYERGTRITPDNALQLADEAVLQIRVGARIDRP